MFCRRCGEQLSEGMNFCQKCGVAVSPEQQAPTPATMEIPKQEPGVMGMGQPQTMNASKKTHTRRTVLIIAGCVVAVCAVLVPVLINVSLTARYQSACEMLDSGEAEEAKTVFAALGSFSDAKEKTQACDYFSAEQMMNGGSYAEAKTAFAALGDFEDADQKAVECQNTLDYNEAVSLKEDGETEQARDIFLSLGSFEDAQAQGQECQNMLDYNQATGLMDQGAYEEAKVIFDELGTYYDAMLFSARCQNNIDYAAADELYNNGEYYEAYKIFWNMDSFKDNYDRAFACIQPNPENGELYRNPEYGKKSCAVTIKNGSELNSVYLKIYTADDVLVSTVFVNAGQKVKVKLPTGSYRFKKATGYDWFGETDMYGSDGYYEVLIFEGGSDVTKLSSSYIYTLSFAVEEEGNIGGTEVGSEGF